ncbi:MAG: hypothetical protein HGB18_02980 [Candidatus Moranbacteria bacterium]|nr:hypothetical protein [Candidatus Moranbacteria bacterium]
MIEEMAYSYSGLEEGLSTGVVPESFRSSWQNSLVGVEKIATENDDPDKSILAKYQLKQKSEIDSLVKQVRESLDEIKEKENDFDKELKRHKSDLGNTNNFLVGVVVAVVLFFVTTLTTVFWELILSNKATSELNLQYNQNYKNYSDRIISQKDEIDSLQREVDATRNEIQRLRDRNQYLK